MTVGKGMNHSAAVIDRYSDVLETWRAEIMSAGSPLVTTRIMEPWGATSLEVGQTDSFPVEYFNRMPRVGDEFTGVGRGRTDRRLYAYSAKIIDFVEKGAQFELLEVLYTEPSVINITSIDKVYSKVTDLPTDVDLGTTYLVVNNSVKAIYGFTQENLDDGSTKNFWEKTHTLYERGVYVALTGEKAGIYRYIKTEPYLVSVESHTLQEAKDYTDNVAGDIETALDSIIAIQEGLIGGN